MTLKLQRCLQYTKERVLVVIVQICMAHIAKLLEKPVQTQWMDFSPRYLRVINLRLEKDAETEIHKVITQLLETANEDLFSGGCYFDL